MVEVIKAEGEKITYEVVGNIININDEFTMNLAKMQRDFDVSIDVVRNSMGMLVTSVGQDLGNYVAQIFIPAREYELVESETMKNEDGEPEFERVPQAFDVEMCVISLWGV